MTNFFDVFETSEMTKDDVLKLCVAFWALLQERRIEFVYVPATPPIQTPIPYSPYQSPNTSPAWPDASPKITCNIGRNSGEVPGAV